MITATILTILLAGTPVEPDTGYSYDQILQMGHQAFVDYYYEHVSMSTAGMVGAEHAYAGALRWKNDLSAKKAKDSAIPALRKHLSAFASEMTFIGSCYTGGGTMWNPVYAYNYVETEEALELILDSNVKINQKVTKEADINKRLQEMYVATARLESDSYSQEWNQPKTRKAALDRAKGAWSSIQFLIKKRSVKDRLVIMNQLDKWLTLPDLSGE